LFDRITLHSRRKSLKGLHINLDNTRPHNAQRFTECLYARQIQRIPHPAYIPDREPSDSFLFGHIKQTVTEYNIPDPQSSQRAITHIFDEIRQRTLIAVFETWINRLKLVIEEE
jgi:hypothetical protein